MSTSSVNKQWRPFIFSPLQLHVVLELFLPIVPQQCGGCLCSWFPPFLGSTWCVNVTSCPAARASAQTTPPPSNPPATPWPQQLSGWEASVLWTSRTCLCLTQFLPSQLWYNILHGECFAQALSSVPTSVGWFPLWITIQTTCIWWPTPATDRVLVTHLPCFFKPVQIYAVVCGYPRLLDVTHLTVDARYSHPVLK